MQATRSPHLLAGALVVSSALAAHPAGARSVDDATLAEAGPTTDTDKEALARLREEIEAQRRAHAELEARVSKQEAARADDRATRDAAATTSIRGYVHVDWTLFRQSSQDEITPEGEPLNENRFVLRRARIGAETDRGLIHGILVIDANTIRGPQVRPWNAEVSLKWPEKAVYAGPAELASKGGSEPLIIVSAGLLMTPFGYEVAEREVNRPFLERATFANALFPQSYDLGLRVLGRFKVMNWALGIMNGDPVGEKTFPGRDPNESKDLVFRVGAAASVTPSFRVSAGISGLGGRGFHKGTAATKDQLAWRDENEDGVVQATELRSTPGSPASPSDGFQRFALGGDARAELDLPVLGTLAVRAELVRGKNLDRGLVVADPVASSRDLRELGWAVGATQEITRWALVGVRRDVYDPDADARDQLPFAVVPRDATFGTWAFMGTLRYKSAKLVAEYDLRTNALGRDASGAPTTLADDSFTMRAAVGF